MFTGIVQDVGRIAAITPEAEQTHMRFTTRLDTSSWALGDSVAVNGCCLTITHKGQEWFEATLSTETLRLTTFDDAHQDDAVNLEPALRLGDALGGHMVSGHVDGVAEVVSVKAIGEHREICFRVPEALARYIVVKGSACINGTSLTINRVDEDCFTVNLIPHTLEHTNLGLLAAGSRVNLETDMIGRYIERMMPYMQHPQEKA